MKKIYFRILAICLSLFLTFSILYKDSIQADALEWVGVAVGYDTAFKFLLGLLGVTVGVGVAEEVDWGTLRENAIQVQLDQGNSQAEVSAWWSNVIHGSLDTASNCWSAFKDYIIENLSNSSGGSTSITDIDSLLNYYSTYTGYNLSLTQPFTTNFYASVGFLSTLHNNMTVYLLPAQGSYSLQPLNGSFYVFKDGSIYNGTWYYFIIRDGQSSQSFKISNSSGSIAFGAPSNINKVLLDRFDSYSLDSSKVIDISGDSVYGSFISVYDDISDIALNPENADTLGVDVIPLPWENIGVSDDAIQDIIDDAIERVIDGTMSLENYWEYVQNITNTYAYSIENNYLLPNENGEDKKADDKVKENTENGAFVLYGLEKVFPFCIPFDIYAFITLLKADPVAPVIEYPIYNPVTQENEIITIDFSEWESVVIIFRYIFDFLLIIGLLLLARPLVGAGGDS